MRISLARLAGALLACALPAAAADPGTALEVAVLARDSMPGLVRAGKGIAAVPWHVGQCLRLPLGLVELVLSPLPGVTFAEGLENTGRGLVAPFRLCVAVLEMPVEVLGGVGDALRGGG